MNIKSKGFSTIVIMLIVISVAMVGLTWYQVSSRDSPVAPGSADEDRDYGVSDIIHESDNVMEYIRESFRTSTKESVRDVAERGGRTDYSEGDNYWVCRGYEQVPSREFVLHNLENQTATYMQDKLSDIHISDADVKELYPYNLDESNVDISEVDEDRFKTEIDIGDFKISAEDTEIELHDIIVDETLTHNRFVYMHEKLSDYFEDHGIERIENITNYELSKVPNIHRYEYGRNDGYSRNSDLFLFPAFSQGHADMWAWHQCAMRGTEAPMHINEETPEKVEKAVLNASKRVAYEIEEYYMKDEDIECNIKHRIHDPVSIDALEEDIDTLSSRDAAKSITEEISDSDPFPGIKIDGWTTFPHTEDIEYGIACLDVMEILDFIGTGGISGVAREILGTFLEGLIGGDSGVGIHICAGGDVEQVVYNFFDNFGIMDWPIIGDIIEAAVDAFIAALGNPVGCGYMDRHLKFDTTVNFVVECEDQKYSAVPREPNIPGTPSREMDAVKWNIGISTEVQQETFDPSKPDEQFYTPTVSNEHRVDPEFGDGTDHSYEQDPLETVCEIDLSSIKYRETDDDSPEFGDPDECEVGEKEDINYLYEVGGGFKSAEFLTVEEDDEKCRYEREDGSKNIDTLKESGGITPNYLETVVEEDGVLLVEQEFELLDITDYSIKLDHEEYIVENGDRYPKLFKEREGDFLELEKYEFVDGSNHLIESKREEDGKSEIEKWEVVNGDTEKVYESSSDSDGSEEKRWDDSGQLLYEMESTEDKTREVHYYSDGTMKNKTIHDFDEEEILWSEWDSDGECEVNVENEGICTCGLELGEDIDEECY